MVFGKLFLGCAPTKEHVPFVCLTFCHQNPLQIRTEKFVVRPSKSSTPALSVGTIRTLHKLLDESVSSFKVQKALFTVKTTTNVERVNF